MAIGWWQGSKEVDLHPICIMDGVGARSANYRGHIKRFNGKRRCLALDIPCKIRGQWVAKVWRSLARRRRSCDYCWGWVAGWRLGKWSKSRTWPSQEPFEFFTSMVHGGKWSRGRLGLLWNSRNYRPRGFCLRGHYIRGWCNGTWCGTIHLEQPLHTRVDVVYL